MKNYFYNILLATLRILPPEIASKISLFFLKAYFKVLNRQDSNSFRYSGTQNVKFKHLNFNNPLGVAAGLDKEGNYFPALASLGFSFVEVGTFTPKKQKGNEYPRIKRNIQEKSLINRLGFNNPGIISGVENIKKNKRNFSGVLGVSIGKNKTTSLDRAFEDYLYCLKACYEVSDYIAVNISSPKTIGLRDLTKETYFSDLMDEIKKEYEILSSKSKVKVPLILKLSPDEDDENTKYLVEKSLESNFSGFIVSNTTKGEYMGMQGGLSGKLLKEKSLTMLKKVNSYLGKEALLISSGGISSKEDIEERMDNGAKLIQIYTSFVFEGPPVVDKLLN